MDKRQELEFYYANLLRKSSSYEERKKLYYEAYTAVSKLSSKNFKSKNPEDRTAGTSKQLVKQLSFMVNKSDNVLEIGCGRGYTAFKLAPYVKSLVGVDVSTSSLIEAKEVLSNNKIENVIIKNVSALQLKNNFNENEFDVCISIDVIEHLHPEDAKEHLKQVYHVLKPEGKYIIVMPNRFSGPHDIILKSKWFATFQLESII